MASKGPGWKATKTNMISKIGSRDVHVIYYPSQHYLNTIVSSQHAMEWCKLIWNSTFPAFQKVRKVTFDKSAKSEMKEPLKKKASARHKNKQPLTEEEACLQTYLNMVKINPTILQEKVVEKRRKDFGGAWAAPAISDSCIISDSITSRVASGCWTSWDFVASVSLERFLNSPHLAHGARGMGRVYTLVQTIGFFLVFPTASIHLWSRHFSRYVLIAPFFLLRIFSKNDLAAPCQPTLCDWYSLGTGWPEDGCCFMFFMFCSSFLKHSNRFRAV